LEYVMQVLVVGSGGREHALVWKIMQSPLLTRLYVAPGNPGTAALAENLPIAADDIAALVEFACANAIDLVVPGPDQAVVNGIADACAAAGIACCAPSAAAARLEGSKRFTKEIAAAAAVPTAAWEAFIDADSAVAFVRRWGAPIVVKADGLAAGKGVVVAATVAEAEAAIHHWIRQGPLLIEECLTGEELSVFALCDGLDAVFLGAAQDHKRVGDGDTGPNTGGMGAISPPPCATPYLIQQVMDRIIHPTLRELTRRGTPYRGILFAGLMLTASGPQLIEFNVRFGDPECQCLLPRLESDLLPALHAACTGQLASLVLRWHDWASVAVVLAARGYPDEPHTGSVIQGVADLAALPDITVFHAGTALMDGTLRAHGGRVLTVVGTGPDLASARHTSYAAIHRLDWPEGFCRSDIGLGKHT
jgi:phosphoribosylamine---glycine ligase